MRQADRSPLLRQYDTFTPNNLCESHPGGRTTPSPTNEMHFPQHQGIDDDSHESAAARAAPGSSRSLFYRDDRLPQLPSESRDYSRTNVPVTSTDSSDSSASAADLHPHGSIHHPQTPTRYQEQFAYDGTRLNPPGSHMTHQQQQHNMHEYPTPRQRHSPATNNPALETTARTHGRFIRTDNGALVEVSEEVYAVRKAALAVLDPITYCWVRKSLFVCAQPSLIVTCIIHLMTYFCCPHPSVNINHRILHLNRPRHIQIHPNTPLPPLLDNLPPSLALTPRHRNNAHHVSTGIISIHIRGE